MLMLLVRDIKLEILLAQGLCKKLHNATATVTLSMRPLEGHGHSGLLCEIACVAFHAAATAKCEGTGLLMPRDSQRTRFW